MDEPPPRNGGRLAVFDRRGRGGLFPVRPPAGHRRRGGQGDRDLVPLCGRHRAGLPAGYAHPLFCKKTLQGQTGAGHCAVLSVRSSHHCAAGQPGGAPAGGQRADVCQQPAVLCGQPAKPAGQPAGAIRPEPDRRQRTAGRFQRDVQQGAGYPGLRHAHGGQLRGQCHGQRGVGVHGGGGQHLYAGQQGQPAAQPAGDAARAVPAAADQKRPGRVCHGKQHLQQLHRRPAGGCAAGGHRDLCADDHFRPGFCPADRGAGGRDQRHPHFRPLYRRGAQRHHPAVCRPHPGGVVRHFDPGHPAGRRQLYRAAHRGQRHRAFGSVGAYSHHTGRRSVRPAGHGHRRAAVRRDLCAAA